MKTITFENLSTLEIVAVQTDDHLMDAIQDTLYIQWELTPCTNRCAWAYPLLRGEPVKFTFHNVEFVKVWIDQDGKVWIKDI